MINTFQTNKQTFQPTEDVYIVFRKEINGDVTVRSREDRNRELKTRRLNSMAVFFKPKGRYEHIYYCFKY